MHAPPVSAAAMKEQPPAPGSDEATHVLVYLNSKTFTSEPGSKFAAELRTAKQAGTPLVLVHEMTRRWAVASKDLRNNGMYLVNC